HGPGPHGQPRRCLRRRGGGRSQGEGQLTPMVAAENAARRYQAADRRVVVTGLGAISSIGVGVAEFLSGLRSGRNGAKPVTGFSTAGYDHDIACEVTDFDAGAWISNLSPADLGRATQFAVA